MAEAEPMVLKVCIILVTEVLFFAALLFGAAGTVRWPAARVRYRLIPFIW